jgi:hypothetical protein
MDILNLNKLMQETKLIESISESIQDTQAYNVVTKKSNMTMMESIDDLDGIMSRGNDINNEIDFSELENAVSGLTECANQPLSKKVTEKMKEPMKQEKKAPIQEASAANPSQGITDAKAFVNADPIKQTDYVKAKTASTECKTLEKANTASELPVTSHKSEGAVDTQAEKAMKEMKKGADANKKWEDVAKKQSKLATNSVKFESFMKSLENEDNKALIESAGKAFDILIKKYI